jgi:hypothetical protein
MSRLGLADRQTTSFIENSREAGILLGGNGILHAMVVALSLTLRVQPSVTKARWLLLTPLLSIRVPLLSLSSLISPRSQRSRSERVCLVAVRWCRTAPPASDSPLPSRLHLPPSIP